MSASSPRAFFLSALLHGGLAALVLMLTYVVQRATPETPKVFELVAGEGDNYAAREAPALGVEGGAIKLSIPEPPQPEPTPVVEMAPMSAVEPEPTPITPAPIEKAAPKPVETPVPNFAKDVQRIANKREKNLQAKFRREQAAAERKARAEAEKRAREEAAKKKREDEQKAKTMTKAEFDRLHKGKPAPKTGTSAPKVAKIDAEGIRQGVVGGSTANKTGGAGGRALTRDDGSELDAYFALLKLRTRQALEKPPGLSDTLVAVVEFRIAADGTLSSPRIERSSGSEEFDAAVIDAIRRTRMPRKPDGKSEVLSLTFKMRDEAEN